MSEVKRAALISFGSQKIHDKNQKEVRKTVRISVVLPESNEDTCPDYNYKEELATAKKKKHVKEIAKPPETNGLDPFNEDDEDVRKIAEQMEAKYGTAVSTKKRHKGRKDDYADIGAGYDESDSFIDNTDGYDEMIPQNVTTVLGGFYINCGALEFKADDAVSSDESSSSSEEGTPEKSTVRKRALDTTDESEGESETDKSSKIKDHAEKKQKLDLANTNGIEKAVKRKLLNHDKMKHVKVTRIEDKKKVITVKQLLKEKREDLNMTVVSDMEVQDEHDQVPKENKKPMSIANITDIIESVVNASKENGKNVEEISRENISAKDNSPAKAAHVVSSEGESSRDGPVQKLTEIEIAKLPENLSNDILNIIDKIKQAAASTTEGKVRFFTGPVNAMLLSLERHCKCLGKHSKIRVYEHLAPFVRCKKDTLIRRAKNLVLEDEQKRIRLLVDNLKCAIGKIMPTVLENYERESQRVLQKKFSRDSLESEDSKALRMPKRRFPWTEEIKKLLKDIITLRKRCYILEGKKKDVLEDHMISSLKSEIQVLWPEGWMSMTALTKFYNSFSDNKKSFNNASKILSSKPADTSANLSINASNNEALTRIAPNKEVSTKIVTSSGLSIGTPNNEVAAKIVTSSGLSITPVTANMPKPVNIVKSDTVFTKINNNGSNVVSKTSKPLPPSVEIIKAPASSISTVTVINSNVIQELVDVIDDSLPSARVTDNAKKLEDFSKTSVPKPIVVSASKPVHDSKDKTANNCHIIDLTDLPELKRKPGPKSKTKYVYLESDRVPKLKKGASDLGKAEEITANAAFSQIIADSLSDSSKFAQSSRCNATLNTAFTPAVTSIPEIDSLKAKPGSDGDDIQKVMEDLKVLQKLSSPLKANCEVSTSAPVSVIAYNKSFSPKSSSLPQNPPSSSSRNDVKSSDLCSGFQDAFQKQFIQNFELMKASHAAQASKNNYNNSFDKYPHISASKHNSTFLQTTNNNYTSQNAGKIKNNITSQQAGSCSMLDDMFANLLNEYGYTKTANSKPQQK